MLLFNSILPFIIKVCEIFTPGVGEFFLSSPIIRKPDLFLLCHLKSYINKTISLFANLNTKFCGHAPAFSASAENQKLYPWFSRFSYLPGLGIDHCCLHQARQHGRSFKICLRVGELR